MKRLSGKGFLFFSTIILLSYALLVWANCHLSHAMVKSSAPASQQSSAQAGKPLATVHFTRQNPASQKPILRWSKVTGAVAYELELLAKPPESSDGPSPHSTLLLSTKKIFVNGFNPDLSAFKGDSLYWRVRGLDIEGNPLSPFSDLEEMVMDRNLNAPIKPIPTSVFNQSKGSTLLYPVYAWIPVAGAEKYEVEILDAPPENPNGVAPSIHRIDVAQAAGFDYYDENPRISEKPFYWRVRGIDHAGNPVGVYSDAGKFTVNPAKHRVVATFGDSITHGGGGVSYPPSDWEYSYQHYLSFPSVNLGRSGDTSQTTLERFEQDVLPFHPQYLIIMTGSNSIRGGVAAEDVIEDLKALKEKCLANNIRPVFLTLPPINPQNIQKIFNEATALDWQEQRRWVNDYIRTQVHIDVASEMEYADGILPTKMAVDGLHLDIEGKKKIAAAVNANWNRIAGLPGQKWNES